MMETTEMKAHKYISKPVDKNGYVAWNDIENSTWNKLFLRQKDIIVERACDEFIKGIEILGFTADKIPQVPVVNEILEQINGWAVEPVPALIQPEKFFNLLANKRFPAATFIRVPEDLDYLQEPDIFHEVYGHTPLLTNQAYGDFMEKFGTLALKANPKDRRRLFRIFWFTIEFGLIKTTRGLRAYGGGILSSIGETQYALSDKPKKVDFDLIEILRTPYRIDIMQPQYFMIEKFDDLFTILDQDILGMVEQSKQLGDRRPLFAVKRDEEILSEEEVGMGAMKC